MALGIYATFGNDEVSRVLTDVNWASEQPAEDTTNPDDQTADPDNTDGETNNPDDGNTTDTTTPENPDENNTDGNGTDGNGNGGIVNVIDENLKADDGANAFVVFTATMLAVTFALTQ